MKLKDVYSNSRGTGFSIDFFSIAAPNARLALLASPFFSTFEPIELLTARGCHVHLIVRLCSSTTPEALKKAHQNPKVTVRYFTDRRFHPKLYIVGDVAMVGSANLTDAGLKSNREVSIVLERSRDAAFEALPGIFDSLWDYADVLTDQILANFERACRHFRPSDDEDTFERLLEDFVPKCAPPSIVVDSDKVSKQRTFLQAFRRKYDEVLIPAHRHVMGTMQKHGLGRDEFKASDPQIEMGRFLGWVRLVHGAGERWREEAVLDGSQLDARIRCFAERWVTADDIVAGDMFKADVEIQNIERIRNFFKNSDTLVDANYDEIFDTLTGCHAFLELLRFTNGGLAGLRIDWQRNKLKDIKSTLGYLIHGNGDIVERAYDCIHDEQWRLQRFGESCVMELAGWATPNRPPFNSRTIKGLRFLGFDVEKHA